MRHQIAGIIATTGSSLVFLLTGGCAAVEYQPDLSQSTAKIRLISNSPWQTAVAVMQDENCGTEGGAGRVVVLGGPFNHQNHATKHQRIGMIGGQDIDLQIMHEIEIAANKPFVYIFKTTAPLRECSVTLAFDPKKDQQYEAVFNADYKSCIGTLKRIVSAPNSSGFQLVEEESLRRPKQCGWPGNF